MDNVVECCEGVAGGVEEFAALPRELDAVASPSAQQRDAELLFELVQRD